MKPTRHTTTLLPRIVPAETEWHRLNALGQLVDSRLRAAGVGLTMGGEPTFISDSDFESPQWQTAALGTDKRRIAGQLLTGLQERFNLQGSLLHYGLGKLYPGEHQPRWALGCYWRNDGTPLWKYPELLAADAVNCGHNPQTVARFAERLIVHLGISSSGCHTAVERLTGQQAGTVIPLLPVQQGQHLRWTTCRWKTSNSAGSLQLLPGNSQLGMRLPLQDIEWAETLTEEANVPLSAPATQTDGPTIESPPNSIAIALCIEVRDSTLRIFCPPLSSSRSYIDLLTAIAATAVETSTPIAIEGYPPPTNSDITGFQITPDPGVIEVNIHPANTWSDLVKQTKVVYDAASTCGLTAWKYTLNGHTASTGGGAHITIGGPTATASPLLRRPDLLRSLLGYWQNHPSLSYVFAGLFVGPTSQSPRLDESRLETLNELDIAFQYLRPGHPTSATTIDSLLSDLLVDCSGNAHRTALCIDKLWPQHNPRLQLGLLEFRGFSMPPNAWMRLVQLVLVRSLVAMVWDRPYTAPLIRWGTQLHDRFLLPQVIHQDLQAVLADLADAGFQLDSSWFEPFLSLRFPSLGVVPLEARNGYPIALELRRAIEPWNVTGNAPENSGTSRTVDASLERLQVSLSSDQMLESVDVTCNGYRVPLIETSSDRGSGHIKVGGVRWRARSKTPTPHPATAPHTELRFEVVDRHQKRSLGGCTFFPTSTPIDSNLARPSSPTEAAFRIANAFRCHPPHNTPCQITETPISAEYPSLLDLRYCR